MISISTISFVGFRFAVDGGTNGGAVSSATNSPTTSMSSGALFFTFCFPLLSLQETNKAPATNKENKLIFLKFIIVFALFIIIVLLILISKYIDTAPIIINFFENN